MTENSFNLNNLSKEDITTLMEALLFSSSTDVCADWYKENSLKCFEIAKKIRNEFPDFVLENVYIYESSNFGFHDEHTEDILKFFPEIKKTNIDIEEKEGVLV